MNKIEGTNHWNHCSPKEMAMNAFRRMLRTYIREVVTTHAMYFREAGIEREDIRPKKMVIVPSPVHANTICVK
jgi:hypothetical protein